MAGGAAMLYMVYFEVTSYSIGFLLGVKAFTAAVLGGIGNLRGALLGGLLLGLVENYGAALFGGEWKDVIAFVVLVLRADVPADRPARREPGEGAGMSTATDSPARRLDERAGAAWAKGIGSVAAGSPKGAQLAVCAGVRRLPVRPAGVRAADHLDARRRLRQHRCSTRWPSPSWSPSASTSSSARPACSTSATSASSPSAPTPSGVLGVRARQPALAHLRARSPIVVAMLSGLLLGSPTLRLRGDYLAIVTLGFGEIIRIIAQNSEWLGGRGSASPAMPNARPTSARSSSACSTRSRTTGSAWSSSSSWSSSCAASSTAGSAGPGRRSGRTRTPPS